MADLFKDILPAILQTKKEFIETEQDEKAYPAFMVNRALSYYRDTVLIANELNQYPNLDKKLQADFLLNIIRSQRRPFVKWSKAVKVENLDIIKDYFGYSDQKAIEALSILTETQVNELLKQMKEGR